MIKTQEPYGVKIKMTTEISKEKQLFKNQSLKDLTIENEESFT